MASTLQRTPQFFCVWLYLLSAPNSKLYFDQDLLCRDVDVESEGPVLESSNTGSRRKPEKLRQQHGHPPVNPSTALTTYSYRGLGGGPSHWVALSNFPWLVARESRKEHRSLHPDRSQACMKSFGGTQEHFFPSAFRGEFNLGGMDMNAPSSLPGFVLSFTLTYTITWSRRPLSRLL